MAIQFDCPHCRRRLAVGSRKAGAKVNCPRCNAAIMVPEPIVAVPAGREFAQGESEPDVDAAASYEELSAPIATEGLNEGQAAPRPSIDAPLLIPRRMLYVQAVLIALVALTSFIAGYLVGRAPSD